jgi:hypothetical protein
MAQLFNTQPEDREPLEFTHFDQWFAVPPEFEGEEGAGAAEFDNADIEQRAEKLAEVLTHWDKTLGTGLQYLADDDFGESFAAMASHVGWDNLLDLIAFNVLRAGYDVYIGTDFIEIYKSEGVI